MRPDTSERRSVEVELGVELGGGGGGGEGEGEWGHSMGAT